MAQKYYKRVFAKPQTYRGKTFRSTLERDFAMFLDGQIINYKGATYYHRPLKWEYETLEFELIPQEVWVDKTEKDNTVKKIQRNKKHTLQRTIYTPDFYLPEHDLLVEVKGRQFDDELFHLRLRLFKHKFPDKKIWIVRHHQDFANLSEVLKNLKLGEEANGNE